MRLIIKRPLGNDQQRHGELSTDVIKNRQPIHLLPCKIQKRKLTDVEDDCTLTAPVDRYFRPYTVKKVTAIPKVKADSDDTLTKVSAVDPIPKPESVDSTELWHSTFRGKPLTGVELRMPNGYVGVLCSSINSEVNQDQDSFSNVNLMANGEITQELMYWNWDRIPTREDPLLAAFDWVRVSEAMMAKNV